jgi:hypothetical protein
VLEIPEGRKRRNRDNKKKNGQKIKESGNSDRKIFVVCLLACLLVTSS